MIICDRCQSPACDKVTFEMDDQRFDLCASCRQVVLEVLTMKKPEPPQDMSETPSTEAQKARRGKTRKPEKGE